MNMKKNVLLSLSLLPLLFSCGIDSYGKKITSLDDFVSVSQIGEDDFHVAEANRVYKKSDTGKDASFAFTNRDVKLYSGGDFVYEETTKYTGFTLHYDVDTYFLIQGDKSGVVSENPLLVSTYRELANSAIAEDYAVVMKVYSSMKNFVGKGSEATVGGVSYSSISLTLADANLTLGYVLSYTYQKGDATRKEDHYITLDKIGEKWGISFYSRRVTDVINGEETYYVQEYLFACYNDEVMAGTVLAAKNNLSSYTFVAEGVGVEDFSLKGDSPLTKK